MDINNLLDNINFPSDIKKLKKNSLPQLSNELRKYFIDQISISGGHFASNLGSIELTLALHYVYNAPKDHLVWDVGHQAYAHKILTGRKNNINTIRSFNGLSPFPKISESDYDAFGVGHSSTSIGAALGMAISDKLSNKNNYSVAIIGDGAMTAGQAFEALNHAGDMKDLNLLVIINDNEMSISKNVGILSKYLAKSVFFGMKDFLKTFKENSKNILNKFPPAYNIAKHIESPIKEVLGTASETISIFNNFGFSYTGPINGNDVIALVSILEKLKDIKEPKILQVITKKGYGYKPAELDPIGFHSISKFNIKNPPTEPIKNNNITYTKIFSDWIIDKANVDERLIAITPAMREGSGLVEFQRFFPDRYFDVGIAEQHAVTFAAGLAISGKKPIVAIYSTFLQRAYDQLIHDVALQNLPVLFAIDRAGIVGEDGPTHAGLYDLSFLRCIPNMTIATPSNENESRLLLSTCYSIDTPSAVRYPKGSGPLVTVAKNFDTVPIGKGLRVIKGNKIAIFAFGSMVNVAKEVAKKLNCSVYDMRFVKPIDEELILKASKEHDFFVTLEENTIIGGAGSAVLEVFSKLKIKKNIIILGIPDIITKHGNSKLVLSDLGLDYKSIIKTISKEFNI